MIETMIDTLVTEQTLALWQVLGTVLGTLLLAAATLWAGRQITQQARELWRVVRGHMPDVVAAVDQPADPLIVQLAKLTTVPAAVWAVFLPAFLESLAEGLDAALNESAPGDGAGA
ncbi:MAG: hypothetical protein JW966_04775 [Anaerolineae bacterium]|nr:hypothetical protein [Anaerolineae bacterium]